MENWNSGAGGATARAQLAFYRRSARGLSLDWPLGLRLAGIARWTAVYPTIDLQAGSTPVLWCAWAGIISDPADDFEDDRGAIFFARQSDPIPQSIRDQMPDCNAQREAEMVAAWAAIVAGAGVTVVAIINLIERWFENQGRGGPVSQPVDEGCATPRPFAQVVDAGGLAQYSLIAHLSPARPGTLLLDWGDGNNETHVIPQGTGVQIFNYTHQFAPGFSIAIQHAVVLECGRDSASITAELVDDVTPAVLGLPNPAGCSQFGRTVAAGGLHAAVLDPSGNVWTVGVNNSGQLGLGRYNDFSDPVVTPTLVPTIDRVVEVATANAQTFALREDGSIWSWGAPPTTIIGSSGTALRSPRTRHQRWLAFFPLGT